MKINSDYGMNEAIGEACDDHFGFDNPLIEPIVSRLDRIAELLEASNWIQSQMLAIMEPDEEEDEDIEIPPNSYGGLAD